ncbi:hypothetical protein C8Q70DRAFT_21501 [Cubamyces menziesii]|nr:hypothetical protein C8Q70DRAFT_21501 [Cubamyces menziesii]
MVSQAVLLVFPCFPAAHSATCYLEQCHGRYYPDSALSTPINSSLPTSQSELNLDVLSQAHAVTAIPTCIGVIAIRRSRHRTRRYVRARKTCITGKWVTTIMAW